MNKIILSIVVIFLIVGGLSFYLYLREGEEIPATNEVTDSDSPAGQGSCRSSEMIFYYRNGCSWCAKVKSDGSLEALTQLGVKITQIETSVGPVQHQFSGVPTFVVNNQVYSGYRTLDQLKVLLGCS